MIVAYPEKTESVVRVALKALLKHRIAVRLLVRSDRLPLLHTAEEKATFGGYFGKRHAHLELSRTYDEFLAKMGPRTRRNFRYYRRKSELTGHQFVPDIAFLDFCAAAEQLFPKAAYAEIEPDLKKCLAVIEAMPSRIMIGLRGNDGEWISLAGGWQVGDRAFLNMQLDRDADRTGVPGTNFWAGSSAPLSLYSTSPELFIVYVDQEHSLGVCFGWRAKKSALLLLECLANGSIGSCQLRNELLLELIGHQLNNNYSFTLSAPRLHRPGPSSEFKTYPFPCLVSAIFSPCS